MPSGPEQTNTVCETLLGATGGPPGPNSTWVTAGRVPLGSSVTTQRSAAVKTVSPLLVPCTAVEPLEPRLVTQVPVTVMGPAVGFWRLASVRRVAVLGRAAYSMLTLRPARTAGPAARTWPVRST